VDGDIVLNAQEPGAKVRKFDELSAWFWNRGITTAVRGLDRKALICLAEDCRNRQDIDKELSQYFVK
jgi:murein DD-endopeptidase